ncbi:MFS multidrug transporter [Aspergillus japonicus CBS 114.51]|uniref:MFS multidrug transporter n=2 Tax=Aspergillus TaxID=5052 RepID=A0A2V5HDF5_ASPV1|nr:MFS multidrug transporter [Aspergillus japonicus CBS 114.51]PYI22368.1 MFS multidrug transporter [Aspergillus violaceofuscus CBS 115571]RAH85554.1 MFS multidrug transporter [Aspergillus japonicus CBS 114.51]
MKKDDLEFQRLHEKPDTSSTTEDFKTLFPVTDLSRGLVGWDSQDDPANPQNFPASKKWTLLALISSITFISPLASSMFSPAIEFVAREFMVTNETLLSFSVTIFLLGFVFGPLLLAPLSEIYGRRVVLSGANWFFVVWQIGCARAPNMTTLIVSRFFTGIGGSGCVTLGAGVIADLFPTELRGRATAIWAMGPLVGPIIGPICGGFVGETIGWRWVFYLLIISGAVISAGIEVLNQETYAPLLIRWKTARLAKELDRVDLRSVYDVTGSMHQAPPSARRVLVQGLKRPVVLFCKSPIVLLLSVYIAFVYSLLYLFFTTVTSVFEERYGFSTGLAGLAYIGIGIGFFIGLLTVSLTNDRMVIKLTAQNGGKFEPEMRLPLMIIFSCIIPITFFWYGWSAENAQKVHWIVPIIGMIPFGVGMLGIWMPVQTYVIDAYPAYAASANATMTASRSLMGALLPLAGPTMFRNMGIGWGNSLLGFLALAFVPVPLLFNRYGKMIRERFPVDLDG